MAVLVPDHATVGTVRVVHGGVPFGVALPPTVVQLVGLTAVGVALVAVGVRSLRRLRLPDVLAPTPAG